MYLHSSAGPGGHTGSRYRLEGPGTAGLRTGQRVRVAGQVIPARAGAGSGIASASAAGGASPQQLLVSSLSLLEDPSAAAQRAVVLAPARRGTSRRLAQQQGLPTVQLSADTASINTLVIPLSFEGCPAASGGGTYLPPWWTQQVSCLPCRGRGHARQTPSRRQCAALHALTVPVVPLPPHCLAPASRKLPVCSADPAPLQLSPVPAWWGGVRVQIPLLLSCLESLFDALFFCTNMLRRSLAAGR